MPATPSIAAYTGFPQHAPPRCVFVTGPPGAGKTRWLRAQIRDAITDKPGARCTVLLSEEGRTRWERFAQSTPGLSVRRLALPCPCCPALADLPGAVHALLVAARPDWLFFEVPALAAKGILADFDRTFGWPRGVVVCLDQAWTRALQDQRLLPFHLAMLELADRVVPYPFPGGVHGALTQRSASTPLPMTCPP